jgi:Tol biopolymer transport system component
MTTISRLSTAVACTTLAGMPLVACSGSADKAGARSAPAVRSAEAGVTNGPIAFERYPTARDDDRTGQIFVRSPDGAVRQLTHFGGGAFQPAWSADGSQLVFQRRFARRHEPDRLYTMNADGSGVRALLSGCTRARRCLGDDSPGFSPDGGRIAFQRVFGPIVRRTVSGGGFTEVLERASRVDLMILDIKSGALTRVKRYGSEPQPGYGTTNWSPDGTSLVLPIVTFKHANKHSNEASAVHAITVHGGGQRRITPWALGAESPDWSPDGGSIVFNSQGGHTPDVYSVKPDGSGLTRLTDVHEDKAAGTQPAWSPDGRQIVFARDVSRRFRGLQISVMNADGTNQHRLTNSSRMELKPAWGPSR